MGLKKTSTKVLKALDWPKLVFLRKIDLEWIFCLYNKIYFERSSLSEVL